MPDAPWALSRDEVADTLGASIDRGLSEGEAQERLERFGPNRLREHDTRGVAEILWSQLESLIVLLLVVAAGASLAFGQMAEAIAIGAVLVLNTTIGFWMEFRAVRSMESLRKMGQAGARVLRDGSVEQVEAEELVPGDVVLLEEGDVVTADLRLARTEGLQVDESALTGESVPVEKGADPVEEDTPLADRSCMVYRGTTVRRGGGRGIVVRTGMGTELGEISQMVSQKEDEGKPLDRRLDALGRKLVWLTLAVAGIVTGAGALAGRDLFLMAQTGIALAVAAIPEGLAIVATVALARGMHRMAKRNAVIRRLTAVETLGSATVICTDKTGTLTRNEMTVRLLTGPTGSLSLDADAGADEGDPAREDAPLRSLLMAAVLANEAELGSGEGAGQNSAQEENDEEGQDRQGRGKGASPRGDPMDLALLRMGGDLGLSAEQLESTHPHVRTIPFNTEAKMMSAVHEHDGGYLLAVKGAPEAVLGASGHGQVEDGGTIEIDEEFREEWLRRSDQLAAEGLRVLAVADRKLDDPETEPYEDLRFLGLVGFFDPPREGVAAAIRRCQQAGIRVIMVTGDHRETARQVAKAVGLDDPERDELEVLEGSDLPSEDEAAEDGIGNLAHVRVFARVDPEQKLRLVGLQQGHGEIVAMTGDGVNDAPALRRADIGIAMGRRGTDVAREASDMVLLDDAFGSIVSAIEQGRAIFLNIRKFVIYLLSGNVGEILAVGGATVMGLPLPLLPLQILYLNLVNDVFPALALGVGAGNPGLMDKPPRDPSEGIIERRHWWAIMAYGTMIAVVVLGVFVLALQCLGMDVEQAVTVTFLGLSMGRLLHVFNMRDHDSHPLRNEITRNPALWGALLVCVALLAAAVMFDPLAGVLGLVRPGGTELLLVGGTAAAVLVLGQLYLLLAPSAD